MLASKPARRIVLWSFILLCWLRAMPAVAQQPRTPIEIRSGMMEIILKRMELQLKSFKQFEYMRNRNLQRERRKYDKLTDRQHSAAKFFNGQNLPVTRAAFYAAIQQSELSPDSAEMFERTVPPLAADQFVTTGLFADILRPDGSLAQAPPVLVGGSNRPLEVARVELERRWRHTLQLLGSESSLSGDDIMALQESLDRWERLAAKNLARSNSLNRVRGQKYFASVQSLIQTAENPARREQLCNYYSPSGRAFDGGTVADLVHHVTSNNLSVRTGSRAHLILSELGRDTLRELGAQIDVADRRAEYYTAQNAQSRLEPTVIGARLAD